MDRITAHPDVMVGKPTIRGMPITVEQLFKALANGITTDQLLDDYPELEKEDIRAALLYASQLVDEERIYKDSQILHWWAADQQRTSFTYVFPTREKRKA